MATAPSRAVMLFGTEEAVTPAKTLRAGPLTVELDGGNLRYVKVGGKEAIRGIAFIVRDKDWGTYNPTIENLKVGQGPNSFEVSYDAICKDASQELRYRAKITGASDGTLTFAATGTAVTDVVTNRTGFVILHPVDGVSGFPVDVERVDGSRERTTFPELIDPTCPFQDLRVLTHEVLPGVKVSLRMEGDAFETEDHRNWNDASYKTYVRPLALPWPYTIAAGETTEQKVTLSLQGSVPAAAGGGGGAVAVEIGGAAGTMPAIGVSLRPEHADATTASLDLLTAVAPQFLLCPFDSRMAAGYDGPAVIGRSTFPFDQRIAAPGKVMEFYRQAGAATGAELVLEAVAACQNPDGSPSADPAIMRRDLAAIATAAAAAGVSFAKVAVAPACDLKCTLPGSVWPPCPEASDLYAAARAVFPGVPLGGGMFSYFTELNRKRPPAELLDFVGHSSCPIVHACDDVTVMENLEALPHIIKSTRAFIGGKPYRAGPAAIGARDNPYGAAPTPNPTGGRVALAFMDPRQRGLLAAAWNLGYVAHMARGQVDAVCLGAPVGEFGLIRTKTDYPQPWFDTAGPEAAVYPVYHVVRGLAAAAGRPCLETRISNGSAIQAVAYRRGDGVAIWLCNLTGASQRVTLKGLPAGVRRIATLDQGSFVAATAGPAGFAPEMSDAGGDELELGAYGVALVETP